MGRRVMRSGNISPGERATGKRRAPFISFSVLAGLLLLAGCANSLTELIKLDEQEVLAGQQLGFSVYPAASGWIAGNETIRLEFDEGMERGSLVLEGSLEITEFDAASLSWSTQRFPDDTLDIDPDAVGGIWPKGAGTLIVSASSLTDKVISARTVNFDVRYEVCVDDDSSGTQDGSVRFPFDEIQEGIATVATVYTPEEGTTIPVRVAVGTYGEGHALDYDMGWWIADLKDGVSLHGGYRADFSGLDSGDATLLVFNGENNDGDRGRPNSLLHVGDGVSGTPLVENITIQPYGTSASTSPLAAVHVEGNCSPILRNIVVEGKTADGPQQIIGICVYNGATPTIENPIVNPGHASMDSDSPGGDGVSIGMYVEDASPVVTGTNAAVHGISAGKGDNNAFGIFYGVNGSGTVSGISIEIPDVSPAGQMDFPIAAAGIYFDSFSPFPPTRPGPGITYTVLSVYYESNSQYLVYERYTVGDPSVFTGNDFQVGGATANCYWDADQGSDAERRILANEAQTVDITFGSSTDKLIGTGFGNFSSTQNYY